MLQDIHCPGGHDSQTGTAVKERYGEVSITPCGKIGDVSELVKSSNGPFVVPIWNSHEGEVKRAAYVWDSLHAEEIKVTDIWAKPIDFWLSHKIGAKTSHGLVGSVSVARTQCSAFLAANGKKLVECELTNSAFQQYVDGAPWDGVLVAPGQGEIEGYVVESKKTANPNNFTSFVQIVPSRAFTRDASAITSWLTGVKMPTFSATLGESQQDFFERLFESVKMLKYIPQLIFVFDRNADIGLLFEGQGIEQGDLLDAEQIEAGDISIAEMVGATKRSYASELEELFRTSFPDLLSKDFIVHNGVNTCLYACPPLGMYTHGYKSEVVEPVVKFWISKIFQLWANDELECDEIQTAFFQKYREQWEDEHSEFIQCEAVDAT